MMNSRNAGYFQLNDRPILMHFCVTLSLSSLVSRLRIQVLAGLLGHVGAFCKDLESFC